MDSFNKDVDYAGLKKAASHYRGEGNYCSVIALCIATGCKFGKGRSIMKKAVARKDGQGTHRAQVHRLVYTQLGKFLRPIPMGRGFMIANAASRLPRQGTFLIYSSGHVTAMKDGVIHDWCIEPRAKGKRMQYVFEVTDA